MVSSSNYSVWSGLSLPYWPEEALSSFTKDVWQPTPEMIEEELAAYRGGWLDQQSARSASALEFETVALTTWGLWRAGGLMLIGMALFRRGVFSAERSPRFYAALIAVAAAIGLPLEAYGSATDFARGWPVWSFFVGAQFNYWPSIAVSLGYVGVVMLACQTAALHALTRPFAAIGRTALINYLLQTILCTTLFYGHGLGWFGSVDRMGQVGVVAAVWTVQLVASPLWLRRFRFGPAEWAWRSLTYGAHLSMRRAPAKLSKKSSGTRLWLRRPAFTSRSVLEPAQSAESVLTSRGPNRMGTSIMVWGRPCLGPRLGGKSPGRSTLPEPRAAVPVTPRFDRLDSMLL